MRLLDGILFIDFSELVACGVSEETLKDAKKRNRASWSFAKDPDDRRKVIVEYEPLKEKYKTLVNAKFGDPYEFVHSQVIKDFLKTDTAAVTFFSKYRYNGDTPLPPVTIKEYIQCANWINLLIDIDASWSKYKKAIGIDKKPDFYAAIIRILQNDKVDLPLTYSRLLEKVRKFQTDGYQVIVNKRFGNVNRKKVKNETAHALLLEMINHHNQFDDTFVARKYNAQVEQMGLPTITAATVGNYRKKHSTILDAGRYGSEVYHNNSGKVMHRERPSAPMLLINSDDNDLDLYYIDVYTDEKGYEKKDYQFRWVLYVIVDAFNDYILGYSIGESPNVELIKEVYRNAINHVKEITGSYYLWDALQFDRFAYSSKPKKYNGSLKQFYDMQGKTLPATVKVARGKIIEQSFGIRWHQTLKEVSVSTHNYAGNNITAKSKYNKDALQLYKSQFPTKEEGINQIHEFIYMMRNLETKTKGVTKQMEWLEAFKNSERSQKHKLDTEQRLLLFGKDHTHTNRITKEGIEATIDKIGYTYEIPEDMYLQTLGKQVTIKYDPVDPQVVLASTVDGSYRMVCSTFKRFKSAPADYKIGEKTRQTHYIDEKKQHGALIADATMARQQILNRANINTENVLRAGAAMPKQLQYAAKRQLKEGYNEANDTETSDWRDLI